jgi:hypothetical protein
MPTTTGTTAPGKKGNKKGLQHPQKSMFEITSHRYGYTPDIAHIQLGIYGSKTMVGFSRPLVRRRKR